MPLYEYVCRKCSNPFEELVSAGETPACPECASRRVERVLSRVSIGRGSGGERAAAPMPGPCGSCGDPRGPGACSMG